ncbi:hypothetical protein EV424DRAFT_1339339 [Suillus variegatus]|nr:hypothetical protein EV424DRAFT_1339339 [Suillus variegatus]
MRQHTEGKGNTKVEAQVKTEVEAPINIRSKIKKGKAKNSNLPSGCLENGLWRTKFLPCPMFWVGNSDYGWSIPENELEYVLKNIFNAVYDSRKRGPCDFDVDGFAFQLASQRIHEWQAAFGLTAVSVLMAFFASTPEYETQEAREEYAEYQLQDCCFVYDDPDNDEQPGAFLSEYILRIFAAHLTAISGKARVDALVEFGKPGYLTALALSAVSVSLHFILFFFASVKC